MVSTFQEGNNSTSLRALAMLWHCTKAYRRMIVNRGPLLSSIALLHSGHRSVTTAEILCLQGIAVINMFDIEFDIVGLGIFRINHSRYDRFCTRGGLCQKHSERMCEISRYGENAIEEPLQEPGPGTHFPIVGILAPVVRKSHQWLGHFADRILCATASSTRQFWRRFLSGAGTYLHILTMGFDAQRSASIHTLVLA